VNSIDNQLVALKNTKLTGKKPAKPEIKHKPNMNPKPQHSFGVDYIYGRHGSRFPTGELIELIFVTTITRTHQNVPNQPAIAYIPFSSHSFTRRLPEK
jgi:hypothetical protein